MAVKIIGILKEVKSTTYATGDVIESIKFEFNSSYDSNILAELHKLHNQRDTAVALLVMSELELEEFEKKRKQDGKRG